MVFTVVGGSLDGLLPRLLVDIYIYLLGSTSRRILFLVSDR